MGVMRIEMAKFLHINISKAFVLILLLTLNSEALAYENQNAQTIDAQQQHQQQQQPPPPPPPPQLLNPINEYWPQTTPDSSGSLLKANEKSASPESNSSSSREDLPKKGSSTFREANKQLGLNRTNSPSADSKKSEKYLFRIGLIVPKTAFLSQYKTYTQRTKDTFAHLLQLSRHHQKNAPKSSTSSASSATSSNKKSLDSSLASCPSSSSPHAQYQKRLVLPNLTFNQYFDIKVVDLVDLAPRSGVHEIIESVCHKLIEQNVSVIVYLENDQDQTVTSLDSQSAINISSKGHNSGSNRNNTSSITNTRSSQVISSSSDDVTVMSAKFTDKKSAPILRNRNDVRQASSQAHFIMHLAHSVGIPTIAWSITATLAQRPKKQRTLHLAPTVAHEAKAMLAIMQRYSWYSFSVISTTLAGHDDFILALRQLMAAFNSGATPTPFVRPTTPIRSASHTNASTSSQSLWASTLNSNAGSGGGGLRGLNSDPDITGQPIKTFRLLNVITIKDRSRIEDEIRQLTKSESRVILLYSTKGEARDILRVAKKLRLTKRSYAWIVTQSVIGSNENEQAPIEFHPGLLGIYFRSNHGRLLDELSRAITIIAHGLEGLIRDRDVASVSGQGFISSNPTLRKGPAQTDRETATARRPVQYKRKPTGSGYFQRKLSNNNVTGLPLSAPSWYDDSHTQVDKTSQPTSTGQVMNPSGSQHTNLLSVSPETRATAKYYEKLLSTHSSCYGGQDVLSETRGDLLYEYFRKSSPTNVFDADGSLRDVALNVVNLDKERAWRKIGCFSDATLTIDDITWPEQAERPPSGTMEKFHLRAVFLEEPSFVNLADPDTETGECKTNRAVRCRYKVLSSNRTTQNSSTLTNADQSSNRSVQFDRSNDPNAANTDGYEYKCCSGFCIDLMEKFATDLKFTYDLYRRSRLSSEMKKSNLNFVPTTFYGRHHRVPDGLWGILENNAWNGLIGEIIRGRADVIVSSTKINSDRQKAVDFTVPFLDTGISILVAKQTGVIAKLAFLEPFDTLAWIMFICVGIPLAATSIFYFEWLSPGGFYAKNSKSSCVGLRASDDRHDSNLMRRDQKFSYCRTLWLVIIILFGSAAHIDSPKGYTARFMSNVWATFAVVFLAVYTANLAAFMITREEYLEFSGISDSKLAYPYHRHPPLKFGTISGGNTHSVLRANKPNLYDYMRRFNKATVEDGVDAVKTGQLDAFVYDALVLDYMASQDPECKLVNVGAWYSMTGYGFAFPRNSRYYDKFNMKMLEYKKNGELDRLRRFWLQGLCKPGLNRHSISKPLDLSQFMSAFLLLGAGILCSVFILVLEHLYILYVRDKLIKSKHRKKYIKYLYPFSLSLAETLRLPDDCDQDDQCHGAAIGQVDELHPPQLLDGSTKLGPSTSYELSDIINESLSSYPPVGTISFKPPTSSEFQENQGKNFNWVARVDSLEVYKNRFCHNRGRRASNEPHSSSKLQFVLETLRDYENIIERSIPEGHNTRLGETLSGDKQPQKNTTMENEIRRVKLLINQLRQALLELEQGSQREHKTVVSREPSSADLNYYNRHRCHKADHPTFSNDRTQESLSYSSLRPQEASPLFVEKPEGPTPRAAIGKKSVQTSCKLSAHDAKFVRLKKYPTTSCLSSAIIYDEAPQELQHVPRASRKESEFSDSAFHADQNAGRLSR